MAWLQEDNPHHLINGFHKENLNLVPHHSRDLLQVFIVPTLNFPLPIADLSCRKFRHGSFGSSEALKELAHPFWTVA